MSTYYKLRIPEPCHEDWNKMIPKDQGRFCSSCSKTVVDFTVMDDNEIQKFLQSNQGTKLCGHVRKSQLDRIRIEVPVEVLKRPWLSHRAFLLALLLAMGTTLLSCKDDYGNQQKIDEVTVVDSLNQDSDLIEGELIMGMLPPPEPPHLQGDIVTVEEEMEVDENHEVPFALLDEIPRFMETPEKLSKEELKQYFNDQMRNHITEYFKTDVCLDLSGRQRILTQFTINDKGKLVDVKVKAPHPAFEKETKRVLNLLPDFIPAIHDGAKVNTLYTLPILFESK